MSKPLVQCLVVAALCTASAPSACATGIYTVPQWLEQGGAAVEQSPEFYWEIELKKLAVQFKPAQKRVARSKRPPKDASSQPETESFSDQADKADLADFQDAIKQGLVKITDTAKALLQHETARDAIVSANETATTMLPEEQPSEFADYHRGAFAFHLGQKHYAEAATAWKALLERPAGERHYRSVWAAFMLGKLAVYEKKPEAVKWFHTVRELAKDGFADSLGLAADSYGWEAKSELEQDHLEKAAQLYLTQLALGDASAIVSLKALVPDRMPIEGTMNFGPMPPENADQAAIKKFKAERIASAGAALLRAARDPVLRRIVTAHVLATETAGGLWLYNESGTESKPGDRCKRWLAAVEQAGVGKVDDADQLGWTAYTAGNYAEAGRWLELSSGESSLALWLKSRLLRRSGKTDEAAKAMAQAWKLIRAEQHAPEPEADGSEFTLWTPGLKPVQSAGGDLGSLHLQRGDFINALDAFYTSDMHEDTAFVAEHVLTADELKAYVDEHVKWTQADEKAHSEDSHPGFNTALNGLNGSALRWLLGRRLVREDRYAEARPYFPAKYGEILDHYTAALNNAANEKLTKSRRARAWFDAAVIARYSGMELMGTEGAPDGFISGGEFEASNIADERETGTTLETKYVGDKEIKAIKNIRFSVPVTAEEKKRLAANKPSPNKRFHYRYVAAALGWKAAALLPDQSDELADVLNTSGGWVGNDDKAADKFFQAIERRASKTKLGRETGARHWFVEHFGPWSVPPKK